MGDPTRGLYSKFNVERTDGSSEPGGKHDGCRYYVLDIDHDKYTKAALVAYADACEDEYPPLAADLRGLAEGEERPVTIPPTDMAKVNGGDAEDCEMCSLIQGEPCAFHQGVSAGVGWMAEMIKAAAEDPDLVQGVLTARARRAATRG